MMAATKLIAIEDHHQQEKLKFQPNTAKKIFEVLHKTNILGGNSQNFLKRILKIFVTLGLKILIVLRLKQVFETDILKCWC